MASPFIFHFEDIIVGLPLMLQGLGYTLLISAVAFCAALLLGTGLALVRQEVRGLPGLLATIYIEFLRGIPLILFLLFMHYGLIPLLFGRSNFLISSLLAFTLFEAAWIGEILRGGLRSVTLAERDAARSLGLSRMQKWAFVILPLAFRRMMPALAGQLASLIKDTSLASIVGVIELTRAGEIIYEQRYHDLEILLFQAIVYFAICYSLTRLARRFEPPDASPQSRLSQPVSG